MPMRRPTSREKWNIAVRSVSVRRRQPKRSIQRIGSKTNVERT